LTCDHILKFDWNFLAAEVTCKLPGHFSYDLCISAGGYGGGFGGEREMGVADMVWCGGGGRGALLFMRSLSHETEPVP